MKKSKATYDKIIQKLQLGNSLTSICVDKAMPGLTQVHQWMKDDQKFKDQVLDARRIGTMVWLDKMQDLLEQEVEPQKVVDYFISLGVNTVENYPDRKVFFDVKKL